MVAADMIPKPCARITDGMAMVQKIGDDQKTFAEVADGVVSMMFMVLPEETDNQRIEVVFDVNRVNSIKNAEREKRGSKSCHEFRNIKADHQIHQGQKCLSNFNRF